MKKVVISILLIMLIGTFAISAQGTEVSNELKTRGLYMTNGDKAGFAGFRNTVHGLVHSGKFSVEAQYELTLENIVTFDSYNLSSDGSKTKANIWFRPINLLEVVVGNNYKQVLPGSFLNVLDDYTPNGVYGKQYLGVSFTYAPVVAGLNISQMHLGDDFSMKINAGINVAVAKEFNLGLAYKMDKGSLGFYGNYLGIKNLTIGGGFTYNGQSILTSYTNLLSYINGIDDLQVIDFSFLYKDGNTMLGADFETGITKNVTPIYAGIVGAIGIQKYWSIKADAKYFVSLTDYADPWYLEIKPRIIFDNGRHRFIAGIKFDFINLGLDNSKTEMEFSIPVAWKYTFR